MGKSINPRLTERANTTRFLRGNESADIDVNHRNTPGPTGINDSAEMLANSLRAIPRIVPRQVNQTLTPVEFANLYHNVRVSYLDPHSRLAKNITVDVHIYNNYEIPNRRANMQEKDLLVARLRRELKRSGGLRLIGVERGHKTQIAKCFFGKAGPNDFAVTFTYALRYQRATSANLQRYCDQVAKLGVDCSGFVNAYFLQIGRITTHRHISSYEGGTLRTQAEDIRALDVLVWQGTTMNHIAVIDHVIANSNSKKMIVVESSGSKGGLTESEYTILEVSNNIFKVDRGGNRGSVSRVKIVEV